MRTHKCAICGKTEEWTDSWSWYGSWLQLEEVGVPTVCSDQCRAGLETRLASGDVQIPEVRARGYSVKIVGERKGY